MTSVGADPLPSDVRLLAGPDQAGPEDRSGARAANRAGRRARRRRRRRRARFRRTALALGLLVLLAGVGQLLVGGNPVARLEQLVPQDQVSAALVRADSAGTGALAGVRRAVATPPSVTPSPVGAGSRVARPVAALDAGFVGALFSHGTTSAHTCTGSVLAGPARNLVLTAAHCVSGDGSGLVFAPGYRDGRSPQGVWTVLAAYADPLWVSASDPQHDYAILRVAPRSVNGASKDLQDVVTGLALGPALDDGDQVRVVAYDAGLNDRPIACTVATYRVQGYPAFDCGGFAIGSSGAPWLSSDADGRPVARGVIGGLHHGGCGPGTSYSSVFGSGLAALLATAGRAGPGEVFPHPGSSGCIAA